MDTKKLRQKILDLAIRGKLVPQDPNDEPASVLLERIRAEKEQLIKEGKIKRSKKSVASDTSHYENVPFEVPESWCWATIGELFQLQAGKFIEAPQISTCKDATHIYPCYGGNGLRGYVESYNRDGLFPIIGRQGALCGNINIAEGKFYATEHAVVVETFANIDIQLFVYFLIQLNLNQYATATAQPGLAVKTINEVPIPLPPINEQHRISMAIEKSLDTLSEIDQSKHAIRKSILQLKSRILDLAISGKLAAQDCSDEPALELLRRINPSFAPCDNRHYENIPFELPETWLWVTLSDISNYGECANVSVDKISNESWVLELEDIEKDSGSLLQRMRKSDRTINGVRHSFQKGDVLYSKLRTYLNKVLVADQDGYCTTEIIPITCVPGIVPEYLCHVLRSRYYVDYTISLGYGVKMPRLGTADALKSMIPVPPYEEQRRIVKSVNEIYHKLEQISSEL